jgi:tripartite ATP-independent transporter DctP family solute receptor
MRRIHIVQAGLLAMMAQGSAPGSLRMVKKAWQIGRRRPAAGAALRHNPADVTHPIGRRAFLTGVGTAAVAAGCRSRLEGGRLILRLSHSMTAGPTALHVFGQSFKELVERKTNGAVIVRVFSSGTLGQERETVQQVQEGLIDFMVSGSAIWGSVAPKLQVLDFPFLWRDWDHVHRIVDGAAGQRAADYLEHTVRMRPLAWGDSFGFRNVVTRSREITEPSRLAGLKIRTIQAAIYVKAVELMGASPTPMAFGEVYTSLQTGVIDGYEHDASTTLQQRFYEVAEFFTCTRHIAGVLGLWSSTTTMAQLPADVRAVLTSAALEAAAMQRARGPIEEASATETLRQRGMRIRDIDASAWRPAAEALWQREARVLDAMPWLEAILA